VSFRVRENLSMIVKIILGFVYVVPIIIALLFSIQPNNEVGMAPLKLITENPTIQNYINVLTTLPVLTYLKNSFIMVIIIVPVQMIIALICAFAFSFYEFPGKNLLFTIFLTAMMIPGEVTLIANYITIQKMGLYNTYAGMTITSFVAVGTIFMLRQHMMSLPKELWEAARIDGCREMKYFSKVVVPLSTPIIAAKSITGFIAAYNAYFWVMLVTSKEELRTIQVGMAQLTQLDAVNYGNVLAGAMLCMILPIVLFLFGHEYIVKGMTAGAVKN